MSLVTKQTYEEFAFAYARFNDVFFNNKLPDCIITLNRINGAAAFYKPSHWFNQDTNTFIDEIGLNPDIFSLRDIAETLSSIGHEMCHQWQQHFGSPTRAGYHNNEWSDQMERIGLQPSMTGAPGGPRVGQKMTHYIITGGWFDEISSDLISNGFTIPWTTNPTHLAESKPDKSKTKYQCPGCGAAVWGKGGLSISCSNCRKPMV